jgi:hypothetical protein
VERLQLVEEDSQVGSARVTAARLFSRCCHLAASVPSAHCVELEFAGSDGAGGFDRRVLPLLADLLHRHAGS